MSTSFESAKVETAQGNMNVLYSGKKRGTDFDLVLVHGLIVSSSFMLPTARYLARRYRVFVPDLIGHGQSDTPDRALSIKDHAQAVACALEKLQVRKPVVVGGSYGCHVAADLFQLLDIRGLAFVGPTPGYGLHQSMAELLKDALREPPDL